jgi:hypothetical protein
MGFRLFPAFVLLPISLWAETLTGTLHRSDSTTKVIAGAKVVVLLNNVKVDSTTTNASGQYTLTLTAGTTYTVQFSAVGFKDSLGYAVRSNTITLTTGTNILNVNLTVATSGFYGTIQAQSTTGVGLPGVKAVLQRRTTTAAVYVTLDSTTTDANGSYSFSNLIAATGGPGGNYQLLYSKAGYRPPSGLPQGIIPGLAVPVGTITPLPAFFLVIPIYPFVSNGTKDIRFSTFGNQLALDLTASTAARIIQIFDLNGKLQQRVNVPPGESRLFVPAAYAPEKGFVFLMKEAGP